MILKSLGLSQLTYHLMTLHADEKLLKHVDKFAMEFIWGGPHRSKIKRSVMIQSYEKGGVKAPCIYSIDDSLKFGWAKRLLDPKKTKWCGILDLKVKKYGGIKYLLKCNFDVANIIKTVKLDEFYQKILTIYADNAQPCKQPNSAQKYRSQIINNNKEIKAGRKCFQLMELKEKEADQIHNFLDKEGKPFGYQDMKAKYRLEKLDFMTHCQIISSIPKHWKFDMYLEKTAMIEEPDLHVNRKFVKNSLILQRKEEPTALQKWDQIIGTKDDEYWEKTFSAIRAITKETKLQQFQFKIVHRILATNSKLFKYKIADTPMCYLCPNTEDTLEHALFECPTVHRFWHTIMEQFCDKEHLENIDPTLEGVLLARVSNNQADRKYFFIALHAKYYIYVTRRDKKQINYTAFKEILKKKLQIHTMSYPSKLQQDQFKQTWQHWLPTEP